MHLALTLLLAVGAPGQVARLPNLDFGSGRLTHWEGQGFAVVAGTDGRPEVTSRAGGRGRSALLHRTFVVPPGAGVIRCRAVAVRPANSRPGGTLDVLLEAPGRRYIPHRLHTLTGLEPAADLLPARDGSARTYVWDVGDLVGQNVRIALVDADPRPGCHLRCGGFEILAAGVLDNRDFAAHMNQLQRTHNLTPMSRRASAHFQVIGNAPDEFLQAQLYHCETLYAVFFDHFRRRGFAVRPKPGKLMIAVFDTQAGLDAYLEERTPAALLGIYHRPSNRLVVYDYGQNRGFLARKRQGEAFVRGLRNDLQKQLVTGSFLQQDRNRRVDVNLSTVIHEAAHQLSFNCGLLEREGDVPVWLAEGLACYCEATSNGGWQGIGEANPVRAAWLDRQGKALLPLRTLLEDDWLRKAKTTDEVVLGYSQSWALFRLLMEERPQALRSYLRLIAARRTPDHRLADFAQAFGSDLPAFERRYRAYVAEIARREAPPPR